MELYIEVCLVFDTLFLSYANLFNLDLKPENLLFRTAEDNDDLLIADFGLSRILDQQKLNILNTTCGTPGYMVRYIFIYLYPYVLLMCTAGSGDDQKDWSWPASVCI